MLVVTGANGFIGSALVWDLNCRGYTDILAADSIPLSERNLLSPLKYSEFCSKTELPGRLDELGSKITGIFHIGACSSTTETNEAFLKENNTEYSQIMFEAAQKLDVPFLYASSAAVYGAGEHGFRDNQALEVELEKYKPLNLYGWSKLWFDQWALQQKKTPPRWHGFRYFNVFGPNEYHKDNMASVIYKAFHQINDTGKLQLFKSHKSEYRDGEQLRDFVYVKDITGWMIDVFEKENLESGIYNMGFGQCRTWLDLARAVFKEMDKPLNIEWIDIPANIRNQYQYKTEASMEKLMNQGLNPPQWSLEKGINDYLQNYLMTDNPQLGS